MRRFTPLLALGFAGCALVPWHPFGTPLTKEKKLEQRLDVAQEAAGGALVEEVHKTNHAIDSAIAGNPYGLAVAKEHGRTAQTLADQIHGAPTVAQEKAWAGLVERQVSLDEAVRQIANAESVRRGAQIAKLSSDLDGKSKALEQAQQEALKYAAEKEAIADRFLKALWVIGGLVGVFVLARVLAFAAQFYPGLSGTSRLVNGAVAKVLHPSVKKPRST